MIYIAAHKSFDVPQLQNYTPLQVGAKGKASLGFERDDTGMNISDKNSNFCELTGLYWIWKNTNDEYKGLVHYRRYFGKSNLSASAKDIFEYDELKRMLSDVDIVLPYTEHLLQNAKDELLRECCTPKIFNQLRQSIEHCAPEYLPDFDAFFAQNSLTLFNMMFCRSAIFDDYCEWLFAILFDLEPKVDLSNLNDYQKRLFGFLSERLLNVWVKHMRLQVKHSPIINIEMPLAKRLQLLRRRFTNNIRYRLKI